MTEKTCKKCGKTKPNTEFHKNLARKDGLASSCKPCALAEIAVYRAENSEKLKTARVAWRAANPESGKAANAKWRDSNPDKVKARNAAWRAENPEKHRSNVAAWRAENPDKARANYAAWSAANAKRVKAKDAAWAAKNPEAVRIKNQNRRARRIDAGGKLSRDIAAHLYKLQRGLCACGCGAKLKDTGHHIDHRMPLALGGSNTDDNCQLLTPTCNMKKGAKCPIDWAQQRGFLI